MIKTLRPFTNLKLKYKIFSAFLGLTLTLFASIEILHRPFLNPERATIHLIQTDLDVQVSSFFSFWTLLGVGIPLLFFSWVIIKLVMTPIQNMRKQINAVISGNLDVTLTGHSKDEFGQMADMFNIMAKSLKATQEELLRSNQDLEHFAGIVAHDLKEPLRKIMFYALLLKENPTENTQAHANTIMEVGHRMGELLNALLAFSKINCAKLNLETIDLRHCVTQVLSDLQTQIQSTHAQIEIEGHFTPITADATQLRLVFQNLIANALKFHKPNLTPHIRIVGIATSDLLEIQIHDNGIGFDPTQIDKLFAPFERLENTKTTEGVGLGLSTVKRILDRHHARISAHSVPGDGSVFSLFFDIRASSEEGNA
jgi:signal transduction histidine kinase